MGTVERSYALKQLEDLAINMQLPTTGTVIDHNTGILNTCMQLHSQGKYDVMEFCVRTYILGA